MSNHSSAQDHVQTLLESAGLTVEGDDLDAVVRLYQRFTDPRSALTRIELGETEPMTIVELGPEEGNADESG